MRRMVEKILNCYGQELFLQRLGCKATAFLQPVQGKGQNMVLKEIGPLGVAHQNQYVYIGPVEPELREDDVLELDGKRYVLRRVETVHGAGGPVYQWGMCVKRGGADNWESNG